LTSTIGLVDEVEAGDHHAVANAKHIEHHCRRNARAWRYLVLHAAQDVDLVHRVVGDDLADLLPPLLRLGPALGVLFRIAVITTATPGTWAPSAARSALTTLSSSSFEVLRWIQSGPPMRSRPSTAKRTSFGSPCSQSINKSVMYMPSA
jgi:hypothetical protein